MVKRNYHTQYNLDRALSMGQERKRLTEQLVGLVQDVARAIQDEVEGLGGLAVGDRKLFVRVFKTNLGEEAALAVEYPVSTNGSEYRETGLLTARPGVSGYMHGDFSSPYQGAPSSEFLWFANNLPSILQNLQASVDQAIAALRQGFESLKRAAEHG